MQLWVSSFCLEEGASGLYRHAPFFRMSFRIPALSFGILLLVVTVAVSGEAVESKPAAASNATLEETHAFIRKMLLQQEILHYKKEVFGGAFCYLDYEITEYTGAGCVVSWIQTRKLWGDSHGYTSAMKKSNGKFPYTFDMEDVDTVEDVLDNACFGSRRWSTCFLVRKIRFDGDRLEATEDAHDRSVSMLIAGARTRERLINAFNHLKQACASEDADPF